MGSSASTQHHFAFQNAEKGLWGFKTQNVANNKKLLVNKRPDTNRRVAWHNGAWPDPVGGERVAESSWLEIRLGDFLNRMFTEERVLQDSEMDKCCDYKAIEVPDNYAGPHLSFPLLPDHATALVEAFRLKRQLHARYVLNLLYEARKHLAQLPNINRVSTCFSEEITVCVAMMTSMSYHYWLLTLSLTSNIHTDQSQVKPSSESSGQCTTAISQIVSTMRYKMRKENEKKAEKRKSNPSSYAQKPTPWFLPQSRSLPSSPFHLGSNKTHKASRSCSVPCTAPLDCTQQVQVRPSAALELEQCHQQAGFPGIREKEESLPLAPEVDRDAGEHPEPTYEEWKQVVDILWSDPMAQEGCKANTIRGGGCYFGPDVTEQLLQKYKLRFLIRSHECKPEGYEFCHNRKVLTIFSASNYYEVGSNRGAYVKLGTSLTPHIVQYQANKATHKLTMRQRISRVEVSALRALREKLFAHSSDLLGEFKKHDAEETGFITLSDWAAAVESVLRLGLPWRMLRPQLVSSSTDNALEYKTWLEDLAKEQLSRENIQSSLLEILYRNRSNLETIFRIIDSDHSVM
ncbi:PREDICTED: serine/threonine-protein phosphatase with EF-hands 2 [Dipodomys ordii]|uniref:protein-serine/threonine phosphatase n=1 Tax=Dipodomys ordii TaxID=10020 RepID=A0A1S3FHM2_DIPOR|nr:PREDICTED: serine/threonine-protein phosphatase with EF-hands 2 [Dipodomys ordii]